MMTTPRRFAFIFPMASGTGPGTRWERGIYLEDPGPGSIMADIETSLKDTKDIHHFVCRSLQDAHG